MRSRSWPSRGLPAQIHAIGSPWLQVQSREGQEEDLLPQTKDLEDVDNRVRRGDLQASSKEALLRRVRRGESKSCGQVKVVVAKLVKGNSPDVRVP